MQVGLLFFFNIGVELIYNVVLVSGVQHSDLVYLQIILHYRLLQDDGYDSLCYTVYPCCLTILYSSLYLLIPYP